MPTPKFGNLPDEMRCTRVRMKDGVQQRCKQPRMVGLAFCKRHGGDLPGNRRASEKAKAVRAMQNFVTPIAADDPEADVIHSFEIEYRRTVGKIRFCDEMIAQLSSEKDLVWGMTKREAKTATEFQGIDITYESRMNTWYEMQMRERKHLLEMQKIWINAKLDSRRLQISQQYVILLDTAITRSLTRLGLDATDPKIRQVVREELLALPASGESGVEEL